MCLWRPFGAAGLRAWCVQRGGYGVPYPEETAEVSALLGALGMIHEKSVQLVDGPYEVDIVVTAADGSRSGEVLRSMM